MVVWITAGVALLLMLMVLNLPPDVIAAISSNASATNWQLLSHGLLVAAVILMIVRWRRQAATKLLPFKRLHQVAIMLFVWLAVMCQSTAQRIDFFTAGIASTVYVEATVTPIGLSDTAPHPNQSSGFERNQQAAKHTNDSWAYRQLVELSQIQPLGSVPNQVKTSSNRSSVDNPLGALSNIDDKASASLVNDLRLQVMLTVYPKRGAHKQQAWLTKWSPTTKTRLRLKLTPVIDKSTARHEFNAYRWLTTRHAVASATLMPNDTPPYILEIDADRLTWQQRVDGMRYRFRQHFLRRMTHSYKQNTISTFASCGDTCTHAQANAVTLSLLTGDRSLISRDTTALYRFAGISHLLAISGAHVLFLAVLVSTLVAAVVGRLRPQTFKQLPRWQLKFFLSVAVAFLYAWFAGYDVPAARTAWMLLIVGAVRYLLVDVAVLKVLLVLALMLAWQDIFILWQAGFWLSFVAVAFLLIYTTRWQQPSVERPKITLNWQQQAKTRSTDAAGQLSPLHTASGMRRWALQAVWQFVVLQLWMTAALLPISLWLFGKVSLWGVLVNLFAIGLFGWVIVPLNLLAGVVSGLSIGLADVIWQVVATLLQYCHQVLAWLQTLVQHRGWLHQDVSASLLLLIILAWVPFLLPRGVVSRRWALPPLLVGLAYLPIASVQDTVNTTDGLGGMNDAATLSNANIKTNMHTPLSSETFNIQPIDTNTEQITATLLSVKKPLQSGLLKQTLAWISQDTHDHWLLLAYYPKPTYSKPNQAFLSDNDSKQASLAILEALQRYNIRKLSGVAGQTATLETGQLVAALHSTIPIMQYWQAGYDPQIANASLSAGITPQACQAGKTWQKSHLTITAVTGWQEIDDKQVHDCTLVVRHTANQTSITPKSHIFYASRSKTLAKLWMLMCHQSQQSMIKPLGGRWWLTAQAAPPNGLISSMQPHAVHVLPHRLANTSKAAMRARQQHQAEPIHPLK